MHDVGDAIPLHFKVVDPATRTLVDADVTCTIIDPNGLASTRSAESSDTGRYSTTFVPTAAGRYVVRWTGVDADSGAAIAAHSDVVNVVEASSTALVSLAEAREHLNIPHGQHVEDEELRGYITAATAAIEEHLGQVVARRTITEEHSTAPTRRLLLNQAPVLAVSSVTDGVTTWDPGLLVLDGATGAIDVGSGALLSGSLRVTYVAGYKVVPPNVILATQIVVAHLWQTQRVPSIAAPGFGGESAPVTGRGYLIPNQAAQLLGGKGPNLP